MSILSEFKISNIADQFCCIVKLQTNFIKCALFFSLGCVDFSRLNLNVFIKTVKNYSKEKRTENEMNQLKRKCFIICHFHSM